MKLYMFRTIPLSITRSFSLYIQQWYKSYRFVDSFQAGSGWNILILLERICHDARSHENKITLVHSTRFSGYKTLCNLLHSYQIITQNADSKIMTQRYCCLYRKSNCSIQTGRDNMTTTLMKITHCHVQDCSASSMTLQYLPSPLDARMLDSTHKQACLYPSTKKCTCMCSFSRAHLHIC
jgi:hypothetical protein